MMNLTEKQIDKVQRMAVVAAKHITTLAEHQIVGVYDGDGAVNVYSSQKSADEPALLEFRVVTRDGRLCVTPAEFAS
jgi:hypothetical protein